MVDMGDDREVADELLVWHYSVRISRVHALAALVRDFARSVLEIEPSRVAPLFLEGEALTEEEVAELEAILRKREDAR
jgi:predicted transcriptional regulator